MVCSRGYSVNLWVKLIMVQMENIEFMTFQTLKLVSDIGLYEFCFWNVASHHGTSYIINSGMQLHIWKWDLGFIHFQPLFGGKWVKSSLNYREKRKKKKGIIPWLIQPIHAQAGVDLASGEIKSGSEGVTDLSRSIHWSVLFSLPFCLSLAFMWWCSEYQISGFLLGGYYL